MLSLLFFSVSSDPDYRKRSNRRNQRPEYNYDYSPRDPQPDTKLKPVFDDYFDKIEKHKASEDYPNTILNDQGIRMCKPGYFSSEIIDKTGCWTCEPKCNDNQMCVYGGKCIVPLPLLVSATHNKDIEITYSGVSDKFKPNKIFCRVGNEVIDGVLLANHSAKCPYITNSSTVSLSFDKNEWSQITKFEPKVPMNQEQIYAYAGVAGIAIGILLMPMFCKKSKTGPVFKKVTEADTMPLAFFPVVPEPNE